MCGRFVFTQSFSLHVSQIALPILIKDLTGMSIPDISGDADTPIGHVAYALTQIRVLAVLIPNSAINVNTAGLNVAIANVALAMTADWYGAAC